MTWKPKASRMLIVVKQNLPKSSAPCWLADATADAGLLQQALDCAITDATPDGHLELHKQVVQHPIDVSRAASPNTVTGLIRGLLAERPQSLRIGVICHSTHTQAVEQIDMMFRHRIQRVCYFGSGADRAVNSWHHDCDLIIVAGTPRVGTEVIQRRLVHIGHFAAARCDGEWGKTRWKGETVSGLPRIVTGLGYRQPAWHRAHQAIVRANIVQAAGRGRAIRESGCDVVIFSNEEAGFPLSDPGQDVVKMSATEVNILTALIGTISYINILGDRSDTGSLSRQLKITDRAVRKWLRKLELRRLVRRFGERVGWQLTEAGAALAAVSETRCSSTTGE